MLEIEQSSLSTGLGEDWWPRRGLGPMPPTDPVLYRLYEVRIYFYCNPFKAMVRKFNSIFVRASSSMEMQSRSAAQQ